MKISQNGCNSLKVEDIQEFEDCRLVLKLFLESEESKCLGPSLSNP